MMGLNLFFAVFLLTSLVANIQAKAWKDEVIRRQNTYDYSTETPLIGILTQPDHTKRHKEMQAIAGPLVNWIQAAGGRAVPIR